MRTVFDLKRTGIFWWAVVSALVYLIPAAWLAATAQFLRSADWLQPNKPPVSWLVQLRDSIDNAAKGFTGAVQFNPTDPLVAVGPVTVPKLVIGVVVGVMLLAVAMVFYRRATSNPGILDDLIAMVLIYVVLRIEGAATARVPVIGAIEAQAPNSYLIILVIFMVYQLIRGRGSRDPAIFFKVLFEAILVCILIIPRLTLDAIAWAVEFPTKVHEFLAGTQYFAPIMTGWAIIGIALALTNIYNAGRSGGGAAVMGGDAADRIRRAAGRRDAG